MANTSYLTPSGSGAVNYSTKPVKTGEKWIDGKDVYRIVLNLPSICSVANQSFPLNIKIDTVCGFNGFMVEFNGEYVPLPMSLPGYEIHVMIVNNYGARGSINTLNIATSALHNARGIFVIDYTIADD